MRRVLITGGSGFIGTNLVALYLQQGVAVANLDRAPPQAAGHAHVWREVDLLDASSLARAVGEFAPTEVVHLAARTALDERADANFYAVNTRGVEVLASALRAAHGVKRVIFGSSMLVCRLGYQPRHDRDYCPTTRYGLSKAQGEAITRALDAVPYAWAVVRPTSIWGPWFGEPYRSFFEAVARGHFCLPGGRAGTRTFGYVGNTVRQLDALLLASDALVDRKTFYLGDDPPLRIAQWAQLIAEELRAAPPRAVPVAAFTVAAKLGDVLAGRGIRFPMTSSRLRNMTTDHVADLAAIGRIAGPPGIGVRDGVRETVRWLRCLAGPG